MYLSIFSPCQLVVEFRGWGGWLPVHVWLLKKVHLATITTLENQSDIIKTTDKYNTYELLGGLRCAMKLHKNEDVFDWEWFISWIQKINDSGWLRFMLSLLSYAKVELSLLTLILHPVSNKIWANNKQVGLVAMYICDRSPSVSPWPLHPVTITTHFHINNSPLLPLL